MRLAAEEISFQYGRGRRRILDRVSIFVEAGERVGLTAPSGFGTQNGSTVGCFCGQSHWVQGEDWTVEHNRIV